jgi:CBS domain-containing protein
MGPPQATEGRVTTVCGASAPVTVDEEANLQPIAYILMEHRIERVPVVRDGRILDIISRAVLVRACGGAATLRARQEINAQFGG